MQSQATRNAAGGRNDLYCVEWDVKLYYTIAGALSDDAVWRLSRTSGLNREQRGLGRLKLAQR